MERKQDRSTQILRRRDPSRATEQARARSASWRKMMKEGKSDIKIRGNIHAHGHTCARVHTHDSTYTEKLTVFIQSLHMSALTCGGCGETDEVHFWLADDKARQGVVLLRGAWGVGWGAVFMTSLKWIRVVVEGRSWGRWHRHHVKSFQSQRDRGGGRRRKINECWHIPSECSIPPLHLRGRELFGLCSDPLLVLHSVLTGNKMEHVVNNKKNLSA